MKFEITVKGLEEAIKAVNGLTSVLSKFSLPEEMKPIKEIVSAKMEEEKSVSSEPAANVVTLEEVRAKLAVLSQEGKQAQVKALITEFGAKKLSDIRTEKYPELLEEAEKL